jgi:radical SAM protein with 4Fe4S-binding SPASM domain
VQKFAEIWKSSEVFRQLRDLDALEGKCGECRFDAICGGCRARAYAATGSFLAEEPFCTYRPELDRRVVKLQEARHETPTH